MYYIRLERVETVYDEAAFELFGETMSCDHWRREYGPCFTEDEAWEKMKEESGKCCQRYRDAGMECRISESREKGEINVEIRGFRGGVTEIIYNYRCFEDPRRTEPAPDRWEDLLLDARRNIARG